MLMNHWTIEDIEWDKFDPSKVRPELISLAKAASVVEHNGDDYARYLKQVFHDDAEFQELATQWAKEEVQHGQVLRTWAEMADPKFDFEKCFKTFVDGYKLPENADVSVRGSKSGELIARCVVEAGTSAYYTMIKDYTDEPVLKSICARIAADELRHYKLFYTKLKIYLEKENIGFLRRLIVALGRVTESEDDEVAYAYYATHSDQYSEYDRKKFMKLCFGSVYNVYQKEHNEKMIAMIFKAIGLKPHTRLNKAVNYMGWKYINYNARKQQKAASRYYNESRQDNLAA